MKKATSLSLTSVSSAKDRAADRRLLRTYGITLADYNFMLQQQGGRCAICRRPPKRLRLAVDHNHAIERTKVIVNCISNMGDWMAYADVGPVRFIDVDKDKKAAVVDVKQKLKRASVRGLLCMICNRKVLGCMERFKVRPDAVEAYLKKFDPENPLVSHVKEL